MRRVGSFAATVVIAASVVFAADARPASAFNPMKPVCGIAGLVNGVAGKACEAAQNGGRVAQAGKQLLSGHLGSAVKALGGGGAGAARAATTAVGLAAIGTWVLGGAKAALRETAKVLSQSTAPQLRTTWFSSTYWRIAGIAAILTLPFLFAAAVQALIASDMALLARAALGYLPLSMLAVTVAAPLTMLLLAASDQMSSIVSSAAGNANLHFLNKATTSIGVLTIAAGSPFLAFLVGVFIVGAALVLWIELLMREAAVYVIVLMLPLAFAAMVWPARRIWAVRAVELLVALILSKFAIVAVLSLGAAAMGHSFEHSITGFLAAVVLLLMGAFTPWALLRLIPLTELASGAAASLARQTRAAEPAVGAALGAGHAGEDWVRSATSEMRADALDARAPVDATSRPPEQRGGHEVAHHSIGEPERDEAGRRPDVQPRDNGQPQSDVEPPEPRQPTPAEPDQPPRPSERIPGMPEIWQQPNESWPVIHLESKEQTPPVDEEPKPPPQPAHDDRL